MNQFKLIKRLLKIKGVILDFHLDELLKDAPKLKYVQWVLLFSFKRWFRSDQSVPIAVRIRKAMEKLGPLYVKFGQSLSTRPDLLPNDIAMELSKLQDNVPPFEATLAELEIKNAFGKPSSELFDRFDPVAFASASIAQAHSAQLKTGEEVIVKILRPNIMKSLEDDLAILFLLAKLVAGYSEESKRLRPLEVVQDYKKTVLNELDLMREAANCAQIGRNWQGSDIIKVPKIHWELCRQNILVQERIFGIPINDIDALEAAGVDIKQLALNGVEIFFTQVFHHNLFHADMHPGNVFVDVSNPNKPLYAAVDFGIVGSLSEKDLRYLARSFSSFINKDYKKIAQLFIQSGWVPKDTREDEFEASIRTVCDPIADKPLKDISFGQLLLRLFQTARDFKMENQPQLVQLEKTLLNIEGLGRQLYPELDFISAAGPVLKDWESKQTDFKALLKKIQNDGPEIRESLEQLPQFARQLIDEGYSNRLPDNTELKTILGSIYKSIIGMGVLISGIIMLSYTLSIASIFIVLGLMILFFGKPIK